MSEQRSVITIPFTSGLSQRVNPQADTPPNLDIALNVQSDMIGGLQTRFPYLNIGNSILGGGALAGCQKVVEHNGELLVFTSDTLYSWSAALSAWVAKGTHLAITTTETQRFTTTDDQIDCDRAELNGTIVFVWTSSLGKFYVAAVDKVSGAVVLSPFFVGNGHRPRVVTLVTRILMFASDGAGGSLNVWALDPANLATTVAAPPTVVQAGAVDINYDVVQIGATDQAALVCQQSPTTSYQASTVTAGLVIVTSIKARTADGPIAVSVSGGGIVQVIRTSSTNVQGDQLNATTLADINTATAIGTLVATCNQIAVAHAQTTVANQWRATVFWASGSETANGPDFEIRSNWVDDSNAVGSATTFTRNIGIASRAFGYFGNVFVWTAFAQAQYAGGDTTQGGQIIQTCYFLQRNDAFVCARSMPGNAAGYASSVGHLPGVALTTANGAASTYSWCGTERRKVPVAGTGGVLEKSFSARAPRDVTFTFDSNHARRTARLGNTLYIATGEGVMQYDGAQIAETGFNQWPWRFSLAHVTNTGGLSDGTYSYELTYRWDNANGERERSTSAGLIAQNTIAVPFDSVNVAGIGPLYLTHKAGVAIEAWRTVVNPPSGSPFFLDTSNNPATTGNPNKYLVNDPTSTIAAAVSMQDQMADTVLSTLEANGETGSVLESVVPPPCSIIMATQDRLFLAGIAGSPDTVWYSKTRNDGEIASFNDALAFDVPVDGGAITGLAFPSTTLIVFRQSAIYAIPGVGNDNDGGGQNFGPARYVSSSIGAISHESITVTDGNDVIFKSSKGWYRLDQQDRLTYIGGNVSGYDSDSIHAVTVIESTHQIRVVTSARVLVFDYVVDQWYEWTIADGLHAVVWNGIYHYLASAGPKAEQATYATLDYPLDIELTWLKSASDLQGAGSVRRIQPLGEWRSACTMELRVARDYEQDGAGNPAYYDDVKGITPDTTLVGNRMVFAHGPSRPKCSSLKVRLTVTGNGGEMVRLTAMSFLVGTLPNQLNKRLSAAQKV